MKGGDHTADQARSWTACAQGRAIAAGRLDPVALTEAYLDAIATHPDGALIYARTTPGRALAEAGTARARAQAGARHGPLDGVPVSWKDLVDVAGVACEGGSRLLAGRVPAADAPIVTRATAAGAVCLGKTHLSELAFSGLGINPMAATPPNRNDARLAPGGSSSGAALSVASGLAALAIGSDTGGSVRIPAAWNDLVGLKTSPGVVPTRGCLPLAPSLDTIGPLARSVEDAALGLALLTGGRPADLTGCLARGMALHVPETVALEGVEAPIADGFEKAVMELTHAGAKLTRGPLEALAEVLDIAATLAPIVTGEGWQAWGADIDANPDTLYPPIEARFRQGASQDAASDAEARRRYADLAETVAAHIAEHGMLVMPTVACPPPPVAPLLIDEAAYVERNLKALRNTRLANLLGMCALTLPTAVPHCGVMLVAPAGEETALLRAGRAVERALA